MYYFLALMLFALFFYTRRRFGLAEVTRNWRAAHWHFFFLGAGFLLLEVQNISKAAAVLGNTWQVNAVIISGILIMILLANLVAATFPRMPLTLAYLGLFGSCLLLYSLDLFDFTYLPYVARASLSAALVLCRFFLAASSSFDPSRKVPTSTTQWELISWDRSLADCFNQ